MESKFLLLIGVISNLSPGIPLILGLLHFRKKSSAERLLVLLITVALLTDTTSFIIFYYFKINWGFLGTIFRVAEFTILALIYRSCFDSRFPRAFILGLIYFFISAYFLKFFWVPGGAIINSYANAFSSITFIVLSISFFFKLMKDLPTLHVHRLPLFWINTAVLVYFSGNFFLFLMYDYLVNVMHDNLWVYWSFHNLLNITKNLLFAVAFWQGIRKPKPNSD